MLSEKQKRKTWNVQKNYKKEIYRREFRRGSPSQKSSIKNGAIGLKKSSRRFH